MNRGTKVTKKTNPKQNANLFSLITFLFTFKLLKRGYKNDITEDDIYDILRKFESSTLGDDLERQWSKESKRKDEASIYHLLWKCYGKFYLLLGCMHLSVKIIMVLVYPKVFQKLISYFTRNTTLTKGDAITYAAIVITMNFLYCTYGHNYMLLITELGLKIKTAFCSLIYRKALKMRSSAISENGIGKIVTLISKDITTFESAIIFLNDIWISMILLAIATFLIYSKAGVAGLIGVLFLVLMMPLQVWLGKLASNFRLEASKRTDHRLQLTQEPLSAIKIVKMYTWEYLFAEKISKARVEEMKKIKQVYLTRAAFHEIGSLIVSLTMYIIVMSYTQLGNNFTAEVDSYLWSCLHILRSSVTTSIPLGIIFSAEMVAAVHRIRKFLVSEEQEESVRVSGREVKPLIEMREVSVKFNNTLILRGINLSIDSGLNVVTGRVASGKSSLLKTILEDYEISEGKLKTQGTMSYVSEEPWLFPSSIRQNILLGQEFDEERYRQVLSVCALETDIDSFVDGDKTIINDRGMNLSKGQQNRIILARAVYRDSDIYLLDDCLSSLDPQVQEIVFTECIQKFLKTKIVVMVSHNKRHIKAADNIILMEDGTLNSKKPSEITKEDIKTVDQVSPKDLNCENISGNTYHERKKSGKLDFQVYRQYCRYGGGFLVLAFIFVLFGIAQFGFSWSEKLVSRWVNLQEKISAQKFQSNASGNYEELLQEHNRISIFYSVTIILSIVTFLLRAYVHFSFASRVSVALHKSMVFAVVNATMKFFDLHLVGNILNRFAKDLGTIDEVLPFNIYEFFKFIFTLTGIIILIVGVNWLFLIPAIVVLVLLYFIRQFYIPTGRNLKRLEAATRSPLVGHFNATLEGLTTIRAHGIQKNLRREFDSHQNLYSSAFFMLQCAGRAFAYCLDLLCNVFTAGIIIRFVAIEKDTAAGSVGLAIKQSSALIGVLQWGIRQWAELENNMTSVERVLEYTNTEKEEQTGEEIEEWPSNGRISFKNVYLTYTKSKEHVLKNINFAINPREKIAIVGRTGAGKSSLVSTLFRLYQTEGTIAIDDFDIKKLSLHFLRSNIAIIPQDPILFTGTIRSNIDPTGSFQDEQIWRAITSTTLNQLVPSLDYQVTEGGSSFSAGQKQLICLARAIVSKNKIVVLDEATANVDLETEAEIYEIIRESFFNCTVLIITHRLQTALYSDRVMVIEKGEIVEFDDPQALLNCEGVFYQMVEQAKVDF